MRAKVADYAILLSWIEQAFMSGAREAGAEVESAGVITTPGVAYLTRTLLADAGVVISASHNPYHDNGIKIFAPSGRKLDDAAGLAGEFEDGAVSFAGIESGMSSDAFDCQGVAAYAFASGFDGTAKSSGRFEHQDCGGFAGEAFGDFAGRTAAHFFVRDQEDRDRTRQLSMPGLQGFDGEMGCVFFCSR